MLAKFRFNTTVGKKLLMAVTGLAMVLFLIGHLVGNLQLLWSKEQFNSYATFLTAQPIVIVVELGLLAILLIHIFDALVLWRINYNARPVAYHSKKWGRSKSKKSKKTWSSTLMMWSGLGILLFIPAHVLHFKYHNPVASVKTGTHDPDVVLFPGKPTLGGAVGEEGSGKSAANLAQLVVNELSDPIVCAVYIAAMILLGLHLYHAISSAATSLGANHPRYQKILMYGGNLFTLIIAGGFILIPLMIITGLAGKDPAPKPQVATGTRTSLVAPQIAPSNQR